LRVSLAGAPNLNLSAEEKRVYGQLFRQADTESVGVVTGEIAVKFFEKTRLDSRVLGEVSLSKVFRSVEGWKLTPSPTRRYGRSQTKRIAASLRLPALASSCGLLGMRRQAENQALK
jgi:hypothetical protein